MSRPPALFFIFHGEDSFTARAEVQALRSRADALNTSTFDGKSASISEIMAAAYAMPFLADKRLVIVEGLLTRLAGSKVASKSPKVSKRKKADSDSPSKTEIESLIDNLSGLPETSRLVMLEPKAIKEDHPVLLAAAQSEGRGYVKRCDPPPDLARWLTRRVEALGGQIEPRAAALLAHALADADLYAANNECDKLVTYAGGNRPITDADVALLTSYVPEADIFALVDNLAQGKGAQALALIHRMLDDPKQSGLAILAMINRQFRLLLQVREALDLGINPRATPELERVPIQKFSEQARRFSRESLAGIYRHLLDIDYGIKTGQITDVLALDLLVLTLAN